jgi:hypothetical protein
LQESEKLTSPKFGSPHNNRSPLFNSKFSKSDGSNEFDFFLLHEHKQINILKKNSDLLK